MPVSFLHRIEHFFFAPRTALSFGLLRILWAATVLLRMLLQAPDIFRYYGASGLLPAFLEPSYIRTEWRFSLLDIFTTPLGVTCVYVALLLFLLLMLIGAMPRLSTIASVLLLFTFHERNPFPFAGGDTVLRLLGFVVMIAPGIEALSWKRYRAQWKHWKTHHRMLAPVRMPMWPWRLLLWQMIVTYGMSVWSKMLGETWRIGTVMPSMLHHPQYSRSIGFVADWLSTASIPLAYGTLLYESAWLLLLIPSVFLARIPLLREGGLRRLLIGGGIAFHLCIDRLMRVGVFFPAMSAGLLGLLQEEDFLRIRAFLNRTHKGRIAVLYDGHCGFCTKSVFTLRMLDNLHRLTLVDYHDAKARGLVAPDLYYKDVNKAMHIRLPDGRTFKAYRAFRALAWHLPVLWPLAPFLYIPGIAWIGERVYARIARKRVRCSHGECAIV